MKIRCSTLPAYAACGCFENDGEESDAAIAGTDRGRASELRWAGDDSLFDLLSDDEQAQIDKWHEHIKMKFPLADYPVNWEAEYEGVVGPDFDTLIGHTDVDCHNHLGDQKSFSGSYLPQIAGYVLLICQARNLEEVHVSIFYTESDKLQEYTLSVEEAERIVEEIIAKVKDPDKKPTPCEYCKWCKHKLDCPALIDRANAVIDGREDWGLENYHSSQITDPKQAGKALTIARSLKEWCESVEFHIREMAKNGTTIPGFKLQQRAGRKNITDLNVAFENLELPADRFLKACSFSINKIIPEYAEHNGVTKKAAKTAVESKLDPVIEPGKATISLVKERSKK